MNDDATETRSIAYETWRFQVDSYWTRTSYFAVFEIAAATGVWTVGERAHYWMALGFSLICLALTVIWRIANGRAHEYIDFWWKMAQESDPAYGSEKPNGEQPKDLRLASRFTEWRKNEHCISYSQLIQIIPVLFFLGWVFLIIYNIWNGVHYICASVCCHR